MLEFSSYSPETEEINKLKLQKKSYSFSDSERHIKNNYNINKDKPWAKKLALKQYIEQQKLKEQKEQPVIQETRNELDKQAMIDEAKTMIYEKLWIDNNLNNNSSFENFEKWLVDALILDNYGLAIQLWETKWKIILDSLKQLASLEWLKQVAKAIWESIWDLLSWNAYEKWKSVWELWLIWSWVWAGVYVWRKGVKLWMKQISRLRIDKKRLVNNTKVKQTIWETNNKISSIIPKKELDFEKLLIEDIAKLWDRDRIEASKFYLKRDISESQKKAILEAHNVWKSRSWTWIYNYNQAEITEKTRILKDAWFSKEERKVLLEKWVCWKEKGVDLKINIERQIKWLEELWIPESYSRDMLESWILSPLPNVEKFDLLKRFEFFERKWIDVKSIVNDAVEKIPNLTQKDALLIFSYTDYFLYWKLNWFMRWDTNVLNTMTKWNIEATNRIIRDLEQALEKMPDLNGELVYRWDSWNWWKKEKWETIELKSFTSVANNTDDTFLSDRNNILIAIELKEWRVKDITQLAIIPKFWDNFPQIPRTLNEWVILPNSIVKVLWTTSKEIKWVLADEIKVKQIK